MPYLSPLAQTVLFVIALAVLAFADLICTQLELQRASEDNDIEGKARLKKALSNKMGFTITGITVILLYYVFNFGLFFAGHLLKTK